jgi:hypothetical protein
MDTRVPAVREKALDRAAEADPDGKGRAEVNSL